MLLRRFLLTAIVGANLLMVAPRAIAQNPSPQIEFGADYYPEDWPADRVENDARLMEHAKFNVVRIVDTQWERLEPEEGHYNFAWLDRVIDILRQHGIRTVLCTTSYVPPAWLSQKHPDFYLVNEDGSRRRWGGMGSMCLNNPVYRQYVTKLILALTMHYGHNPAVIGWQIDNELGGWGYACYDQDYCVPKFRDYLKKKFGTLDALNRRLFTVSYGHTYSSWDQIPLRLTATEDALQAPLILEALRFFSTNITEFMAFQADLLRRNTTGQFITHNGPPRETNGFDHAKVMDFLCDDSYPRTGDYLGPAFAADTMRGFNHGKSFLEMEHRSGTYGGYSLLDATAPPGMSRLWAWQTLAHGSDGVLFFRWRMNNGGSEQYWQGLMNYDGSPGRAYPEVVRMGAELQKIGSQFSHAPTPSSVAEIMSYDTRWALEIGDDKFPYFDQLQVVSSAFHRWGLNVDIVEPTDGLEKYKVVAAPTLHIVNPAIVANLEKFVEGGGVLILTARSGFKNIDDLSIEVPPGPLEHLAKVRVKDFTLLEPFAGELWMGFPTEKGAYQPSPDNTIKSVTPGWPGEYQSKAWAEILEPDGAKPLFNYQKDFYAGRAAVTVADFGKGKVIYVGTLLEPRFYAELARQACDWANLKRLPEIPDGVDYTVRQMDQRSFHFVLNFSDTTKTIKLPGEYQDLLTGKVFTDQVTVPRLDLCVLTQNPSKAPGPR